MVKQISKEEVLKDIHEEIVELESKIAKWNPETDSLQLIKERMYREEELALLSIRRS